MRASTLAFLLLATAHGGSCGGNGCAHTRASSPGHVGGGGSAPRSSASSQGLASSGWRSGSWRSGASSASRSPTAGISSGTWGRGGFHVPALAPLRFAAEVAQAAIEATSGMPLDSAAAQAGPQDDVPPSPSAPGDAEIRRLQSPPDPCRSVEDCGIGVLGHGTVCDRASHANDDADALGLCLEACRTSADCWVPATCVAGLDPIDPTWSGCLPSAVAR